MQLATDSMSITLTADEAALYNSHDSSGEPLRRTVYTTLSGAARVAGAATGTRVHVRNSDGSEINSWPLQPA